MTSAERTLILCVDRDNDIGTKANIETPVIGKDACIHAATELMRVDPEDVDGNTIFQAVKLLEEIPNSEVVILAGDKSMGYLADKKIAEELDTVLQKIPATRAVLVSDGASDDLIVPVIESRLKIDSVRRVFVKQAKELEKTYVVLLEKLKEPHYARIFFGIPGAIILLWAVGEMLGLGIIPLAIILGMYLLMKAIGIEEHVFSLATSFTFSIDKMSSISYLLSFFLLLLALLIAVQGYYARSLTEPADLETLAFSAKQFLSFMPWILLIIIGGKTIEAWHEKRLYKVPKYFLYFVNGMVILLILQRASEWVIREASFADFFFTMVIGVIIAALSIEITRLLRSFFFATLNLVGKDVLNRSGAYVGRVIGTSAKKNKLVILTPFGEKMEVRLERVADVEEKIMLS